MQSDISRRTAARSWIDHSAMRQTCSRAVVFRSLMVAALIGTILNAINQGPEFLAGKSVDGLKVLLTYAVPFFVASYGAYSAFRAPPRSGESKQ